MSKTIYYKSKINIAPDSYYTKDSPEKIRSGAKVKFNLRDIKDEDLDKYDVNFYDGSSVVSFNAKSLIDTKVKDTLAEQEAKDKYIIENFTAYNIRKAEINDDSEIFEIKKLPDFGGFITHPACNLMPDYYYFKIKAYFDVKNYKVGDVDYFVARDANRDSFFRNSQSANHTVIYFPKTQEHLSTFKQDFSTFEFTEITDNAIIVDNDFDCFNVERIVIEKVTGDSDFGKTIELKVSTLKDAKIGRFLDMTNFYENEKKELAEVIQEEKDRKLKLSIKNKSDKENKINEFLERMAQIQDFIQAYKDGGVIDYNRFPTELIDNKPLRKLSKADVEPTFGDHFKFD